MRKVIFMMLTALPVCLLSACYHAADKGAATGEDTTAEAPDSLKHSSIIVGKDDAKFVTTIAQACMAEIQIGALAKQQGTDKRVKNFGAMMVKDLTKGKGRLTALAKQKKITLPDSLTADDQMCIAELAKKTGKDFDHAYLDKTRDDYKRAYELFEHTSKYAFDPDIKFFAIKNLATIQRHLDLIDAVHGSLR